MPSNRRLSQAISEGDGISVLVDVTDLEAWLIANLRVVEPDRMASALRRAETTAAERFSAKDIVAAMRRVLSTELARQT